MLISLCTSTKRRKRARLLRQATNQRLWTVVKVQQRSDEIKKWMIKKPLPQDELADGPVSITETYVCSWRTAASLMRGSNSQPGGGLHCQRLSLCLSLLRGKRSTWYWTTNSWSRVEAKSAEEWKFNIDRVKLETSDQLRNTEIFFRHSMYFCDSRSLISLGLLVEYILETDLGTQFCGSRL